MCPGETVKAWRELRLCPEAIAIKKAVLIAKLWREVSERGSKGGLARALSTADKLHEGAKDLVGGRFKKKDFNKLEIIGEFDTEEPSENPRCKAAIAER